MLNSLSDSLIVIAEIGSNRLLTLDQAVVQRCTALQGKCIAIELTDIELTLYCHPGNWGIRLSRQAPTKAVDANISGRLFALLNLAADDDKVSTSIRERVSISGDANVAQQMQKILSEIDIDWEEELSKYTGDVLAFQIYQQARKVQNWLQGGFQSITQTTSEYLREEAHMTPTLPEYEHFQQQLTTLRQDVDRTEARIRQLLRTRYIKSKT